MSAPVLTVLVVEDEPAIAEMVALHLRHAGYGVRLAADAVQAQAQVDRALPDAVVLDWMLPGGSGLQLARRWRADARTRGLPVIVLTARATEADKVAGLDAGADDYLTKPFSPGELMARLRALLRRRAPETDDAPLEIAGLRLDPSTRRVAWRAASPPAEDAGGAVASGAPDAGSAGWQEVRVGPTEFRLLHYLMAHPERVHSRSRLLDRVWGEQADIEERTVDVHVKRLREALQPVGAAGLIETVRGAGYRLARPAAGVP